MRSEWRENKAIMFGDYDVRFMTLWEDTRDAMCDSLRPEWAISQREQNRAIRIMNLYAPHDSLLLRVNREDGNRIYREMVKIDNHGYGRAEASKWVAERKVANER